MNCLKQVLKNNLLMPFVYLYRRWFRKLIPLTHNKKWNFRYRHPLSDPGFYTKEILRDSISFTGYVIAISYRTKIRTRYDRFISSMNRFLTW